MSDFIEVVFNHNMILIYRSEWSRNIPNICPYKPQLHRELQVQGGQQAAHLGGGQGGHQGGGGDHSAVLQVDIEDDIINDDDDNQHTAGDSQEKEKVEG